MVVDSDQRMKARNIKQQNTYVLQVLRVPQERHASPRQHSMGGGEKKESRSIS